MNMGEAQGSRSEQVTLNLKPGGGAAGGRRTFHGSGTHVPGPHVVHRPETADFVRKPRLTLVNGVTKMVPPGSGSAVLDFVTRVVLCSQLLSPASQFHDPTSFQSR